MTDPVPAPGLEARTCDGPPPGHGVSPEHLRRLLRRISNNERDAFAELFDHLSRRLLATVQSRVPDPHRATAIVTATFVEVWWLAGCHAGPDCDVVAWVDRIAHRRAGEGPPATDAAGQPAGSASTQPAGSASITAADVAALRDRCAELELTALLGRPAGRPG
jgi:hypothetical protein